MAQDGRSEATIHSATSQYDGRHGYVVERDEEGGFEVELPGVPGPLHFEDSEVEISPAVAR
jgi:hypothetical protein